MRPPKPIAWLAIWVVLPQMTGCASFQPYEGELPNTVEDNNLRNPRRFRVTTRQGVRMELVRVSERDHEIHGQLEGEDVFDALRAYGEPGSNWVSIPMAEVRKIEREGEDILRSLLLTVGVAAGVCAFIAGLVWEPRIEWR